MKKIYLLLLFQTLISIAYSQDKKGVYDLKTSDRIVNDICFSSRGGVLAIADNNVVKVYSVNDKEFIQEFKNGHKGQIMALDISRDSTLLASGGKDSTIVIRNFPDGNIVRTLNYQKGIIASVKISPDSRYLASGGTDNKIYLYDIEKNELVGEFENHKEDVTSLTFSPDGNLLAGAGGDGLITVFDIGKMKLTGILKEHTDWIRGISFNTDGSRLLSCGDDSMIITWNTSDPENITAASREKVGGSWLLCLDYGKDQDAYAYGSLKGTIKIRFPFGNYNTNLHVPVNRIKLMPNLTDKVEIAVATRGKGVMLVNVSAMKYKRH